MTISFPVCPHAEPARKYFSSVQSPLLSQRYPERQTMSAFDRECLEFLCPQCGKPMLLPHRSPEKMFPHQQDRPMNGPHAILLCTHCEQMHECSIGDFHPHRIGWQARNVLIPILWSAEGECVHEHCGVLKPIYFVLDAEAGQSYAEQFVSEHIANMYCSAGHPNPPRHVIVRVQPVARQD